MLSNLKQHHANMQERFDSGDDEHLQGLHAALEKIRLRIRECRYLAQGAVKKARGCAPADYEEEQLQKVEAQIADAQQFLTEALAALRARGADVLHSATVRSPDPDTPSAAADETSCDTHEVDDSSAVVMETADAAAMAAVDAAEVAMAAVDQILLDETSSAAAASIEPEAPSTDSADQPAARTEATTFDHAQVFLSHSISAIRSRGSGLFGRRGDNWVTIPASSSFPEATEGAHTTPATSDENSPGTLDEFLLVSDDAKQEDVQQSA